MAVLAGFVNRIFALPGKLSDLEVISLSPGLVSILDSIGVWAFFVVIGGFAVWVIYAFDARRTYELRCDISDQYADGDEDQCTCYAFDKLAKCYLLRI